MKTFSRLSSALLVILALALGVNAQDEPAPAEEIKPDATDEKKTEADAPSYKLKWDIAKGSKFEYRQKAVTEQDMFGTKVKNVNVTDYTLHCLGFTEEGSVQLEYTYDRVAFKVETQGINLDYDSAKPDPNELEKLPELKGTAALVGHKFSYEITTEMKVENLKGWDKVREQVLKDFDADMRAALEPTYSDVTRIGAIEAGMRALPTKKVKVGDEWANHFDEPAGELGLLKHDWTLKFASVETKDKQQLATITNTAKLTFEQFKDGPYANMKVVLKDADETGTLVFDIDKGAILSQSSSQSFTMEYHIDGEVMAHSMVIEMSDGPRPVEKPEEAEEPTETETKPD